MDLRISPHQSYLVRANRHPLISRLETLEKLKLAKPAEPGVWELSPRLQAALTRMGKREDIYSLMRDALGPEAAHRGALTYRVHGAPPFEVTSPPSKAPTTWRHAKPSNSNCVALQPVPIGRGSVISRSAWSHNHFH